ncbi:hypothetical protein LAZ67_1000800 [Cordylochernes scorpioides]|uniref:Reverse transcriptase domain-containing protein n=1 Tax=Cordylochernes scorpioides TaxID=51811 RepID=A0ABY6JWE5_9ARAC|nr:hypothetical protein LAZ67_1000800 [Cordylochernes scorpioides]
MNCLITISLEIRKENRAKGLGAYLSLEKSALLGCLWLEMVAWDSGLVDLGPIALSSHSDIGFRPFALSFLFLVSSGLVYAGIRCASASRRRTYSWRAEEVHSMHLCVGVCCGTDPTLWAVVPLCVALSLYWARGSAVLVGTTLLGSREALRGLGAGRRMATLLSASRGSPPAGVLVVAPWRFSPGRRFAGLRIEVQEDLYHLEIAPVGQPKFPEKLQGLSHQEKLPDKEPAMSWLEGIEKTTGRPDHVQADVLYELRLQDWSLLSAMIGNLSNPTNRVNYISKKKFYAALIRDKKKKYYQALHVNLSSNTHDSKNFWKTISIYKKISFIQGNISLQEWHQFYDKLLSSETSTEYILPMLNTLSVDTGLLAEITMKEIIEEISRLKNCKAAGIDEVPNEAIKLLPHSYLLLLKDLYNRILRSAVFPSFFSKSIIHPIYKNGDSDNPSNYRGISLLSNFAKLFIAILRSRLVKWIETNDIIPVNQAGFRSTHSCQDHIFILTSVIQLARRKKRGKCYSFFINLKKAFDTVPHALLWAKLVKIGLNHRFVNLIKCYYEDMTAAVCWNNSITEFIEIRWGGGRVLQGDPLSPCLFLLFINDLIKIFDDSGLSGIYLPNFGNIHLLLYAHDIVLIGDSKINLQLKINILKTYLETNLLTLNENKSRIMVFRNGGKVAHSERWYWGQSPLSVTSKYTYLGYPLTPSISFTQVALNYRGRTMAAMGAVGEIILKSKLKSFHESMRLLDSMILTVLLYAAPIWAHNQSLNLR